MKLSGNKGEWSELYVLLKLLSTGELYAADEKLQKIKDVYYPILKIIRQEDENKHLEYVIVSEEQGIEIHWNAEIIRSITQKEMAKRAAYLYEKIVEGGSRAFEIPGSDTIMNELACTKISAPSTDKTDITMQIHDINTGYEPICGFSIKSELGSAPTLLNASGATNFVYEVSGISDELAEQINAIDSKTKILDRIQMITENGTMKYSHMKNKVFSGNLMLIDTYMEEIIAHLLLLYYQNQATDSDKLIRIIEEQNPLGYPRKGIYAYKFILNQRIIAGNAQFTGIAAGRGVGFTTGLLLLRKGLGMRETPIRPHSWHCRMQSGYQYGGNRKRPPVWRRHRGSLRPRGRNLGGVEGMTGGCGSGCDPAIHTRRLRVYHRPRRLRMASRISIFFAARRFEPLNSMG